MACNWNGLIVQWGEVYSTSYKRNINGTITNLKFKSENTYSVIITGQSAKYESSSSELEISASAVSKISGTTFMYRVYGHSSSDTPYGICWIAIGY